MSRFGDDQPVEVRAPDVVKPEHRSRRGWTRIGNRGRLIILLVLLVAAAGWWMMQSTTPPARSNVVTAPTKLGPAPAPKPAEAAKPAAPSTPPETVSAINKVEAEVKRQQGQIEQMQAQLAKLQKSQQVRQPAAQLQDSWLLGAMQARGCGPDWLWQVMRINGITERGLVAGLSAGSTVRMPAGCNRPAPADVSALSQALIRKHNIRGG